MKRAVLQGLVRLARVAIAGVLVACGGDGGPGTTVTPPPPPPTPTPTAVLVAFDSNYVRAGSQVTATAVLLDQNLTPMTSTSAPVWSIEGAPGLATISSSGRVTSLAAGVAVVVARIDGIRGEDALVIRPTASLAQVIVSLDSSSLLAGSSTQARVVLLDSVGEAVTPRPVTWSIRGPAGVATISATGVVTALAAGTVAVVASAEGIEGEAILQVVVPSVARVARVIVTVDASSLPVGRTTQARAQAVDSNGTLLLGRTVTWSISPASAAATISATGVVTAVAVGTARVVGVVEQVSGSANVAVIDTTTPVSQVQLPALPRDTVATVYPVVRGRTIMVRAGDNLQSALNSAQRGDEVVLQAGATFAGTYTLPAKPGSAADGWILVRSDRQSALPPFGTRVAPSHAALMPRVQSTTSGAALQTASGASGWWVTGIEFTIAPSFSSTNYGLVLLGDGSNKQNSLALVPSDLVLDRVYVHAHDNVGTSRCVAMNSARSAVVNSYLDHCHLKGFDSQAIAGWNGPGPFKIENNALLGAGENIIWGGSDPAINGLIPSDITVRRNHLYTPLSWRGAWTKKNLFETKNVQRLLVEENVFDGSWTDAQVGYAFVLKSANQSGRCGWCASRDITIRYNLVRNAGAGFNLTGREGSNPHPVGELMTRVLIEHNVLENIAVGPYDGDGRLVQLLQNLSHLTIRNNTMTTTSTTLGQFLNIGSLPAATAVSYTRNLVSRGRFGVFSSAGGEGAKALNNIRAPVEWRDVVVISSQRPSTYPVGTTFVNSLAEAIAIPNVGANEALVRSIAQVVVIP